MLKKQNKKLISRGVKLKRVSSPVKFLPWSKVIPKDAFPLEHGSRAGVIVDQKGSPQLFVFDTFALLDILSEIDDRLVDSISSEEYHSKKANPAGWLIDELESKMPLSPNFVNTLYKALAEARKKGWIPFSKIKRELEFV